MESLPYDDKKGCPTGYHKRSSYTSKLGHRVSPRCVRSQTVYRDSRKNYTRRVLARQRARLATAGKTRNATHKIKCRSGYIERKGYVRRFDTSILKKGYTVKKSGGKSYRIYPEKASVYVKPSCVKDRGLPGSGPAPGEGFGALRKGELKKHGYAYYEPKHVRETALRKAVAEFGALGVFRKLDVVAKLSKRTVPEASRIFKIDREWIRHHYKLKAPQRH
jgi:hypothetical protein